MISIEADVYSPIAQAVRENYPGTFVSSEYVRAPAKNQMPHVSIVESDNYVSIGHLDTSATERYSTIMYEVNVYSNKQSGKKSEAKEIMGLIDHMMYARNFTRLSLTPVPNLEDATIYRLTARYRAETDGTYIYRI